MAMRGYPKQRNEQGFSFSPQDSVREKEELLQQLWHSDERFRIAAENSSEIILEYNVEDGSIYHVTDRVTALYGIPQFVPDAAKYLTSRGTVQPESAAEFINVFRRLKAGEPKVQCVLKTRTAAGEIRWAELILTNIFGENGAPERAVGVLKDITGQREAELQYESEVRHRDAMMKDALLYYEADLTARRMIFGLEALLEARGMPYTDSYEDAVNILVDTLVYIDDRDMVRETFAAESLLRYHAQGRDKLETEYRRMGENGSLLWVRGTAYLIDDQQSGSVRIYYYVHDINAAKLEQLRLQEQAERDLLTGLYNKGTTERLIQKAVQEGEGPGKIGAFFIVDLDNFKNVNDQLGHSYGDAVLSETARRLQGMCRSEDIAGRIGGDEFALYLKHLPSSEVAERKAEHICEMFHGGYRDGLNKCRISGTVGISLLPNHGASFEELYRCADRALYTAKAQGKDAWALFDSGMTMEGISEMARAAIDRSEGKSFAENIIEYVLRILYESHDLRSAGGGVIELVAKHFGYHHAYVFEATGEDYFTCTCEWCDQDVNPFPSEIRTLQGDLLRICRERFGEDGLYVMNTPEELPETEKKIPALASIYSRIQCALSSCGRFQGFLGFDRLKEGKTLTAEEQASIQGVAQMLDIFLSERRTADKLAESDVMLQAVADSLRSCTYIIDPRSYQLQFVNRNTRQIIPEAKPGTLCYETIRGRRTPCEDCPIKRMVRDNLREYRTEMYLDRYQLWAKIDTSLISLNDGREYGLFNGYDFAEYKKQNGSYLLDVDAFTEDSTLYDALSLSTDDYIYMCDMPKNIFYFPKAMVEEFALPGQIIEDAIPLWASCIHEDERDAFLQDIDNMVSGKTNVHNLEYRAKNKDGNWIWLHCRGYLEHDSQGTPTLFAGVITNLGKKTKVDHLTGLADKYEFEVQTRARLADRLKSGALLLMGLDNFKYINDLYGWEFGDDVLREAARKMQAYLPPKCQLYRLDGDQFGVFFSEPEEGLVENYYQSVFHMFQRQQQFGEHRYFCTVSGGYVTFAGEIPSFTALFKQAEHALDWSKTEGKNRLTPYDDALMSGKERTLTLIERLRESVEQNFADFELYFQPQVEPRTYLVKSAEALLRWRCNEYGSVPPDEFIPLLEQTGLIHKVGKWVLEKAYSACRDWRTERPAFTVNVNISFVQLQDKTFLPYLAEQIEMGELDPAALHLELTESCIAAGSRSLIKAFQTLRNMGFYIEMDDFGTGYSSLEILKNAPADVVKIDHAFVMDITRSDFDATFIQFIVSLCHSVGIQVCLEGVETWTEYYLVEPMELDLIQGYLFGRPQNRAQFEEHFLSGDALVHS